MTRDGDGIRWTRSRRCDSGECVEVVLAAGRVLVRGSEEPDGAVLKFHPDDWRAFLALVKSGSTP
jgi:hypothetical protein